MSRKNVDTREKILDAAWTLLEESPQQPVKVGDIARAAGISRQALYLHFPSRAELLIATARHLDQVKDVDALLAASRAATGAERLDRFIEAWGSYIPEIYGVAKAFMAMQESDEAARIAWADRMAAVRHGCAAAIRALSEAGELEESLSAQRATDILWMLLSVRNWEQLTIECGWSQADYIDNMKETARRVLFTRGKDR